MSEPVRPRSSVVTAVYDRRFGRARRASVGPVNVGVHRPLLLQQRSRAGFTLVELLIVVGLIILLTVGGAIALGGRGGEGMALANAQSMVASMLGAARAQAALHQTRTRLAVYATTPPGATADSNKYLRCLVVLREDPVDSGRYLAVGDHLTLPAPICVVPPTVPVNHLRPGTTWPAVSTTSPHSTLVQLRNNFSYRSQANATATPFFGTSQTQGLIYYLEFGPDGTVTNPLGASTKIALTTAILGGNALPQFNNPNGVRGIVIRKTGALSLVDESTGF